MLRHGTDGHYYFTHEGCITHHQLQDVAVRCAQRIPGALYQDKPVAPAPVAPSVPPVRVTQNSLRVAKATRKADRASRTRGMRRVLFGWKHQTWRSAVKAAKAEAGKTYSAKVFTTATGAVTWRCDHHHPTQLRGPALR